MEGKNSLFSCARIKKKTPRHWPLLMATSNSSPGRTRQHLVRSLARPELRTLHSCHTDNTYFAWFKEKKTDASATGVTVGGERRLNLHCRAV